MSEIDRALGYYQFHLYDTTDMYRIACSTSLGGPIYDSKNSHKKTNFKKNKRNKKK